MVSRTGSVRERQGLDNVNTGHRGRRGLWGQHLAPAWVGGKRARPKTLTRGWAAGLRGTGVSTGHTAPLIALVIIRMPLRSCAD